LNDNDYHRVRVVDNNANFIMCINPFFSGTEQFIDTPAKLPDPSLFEDIFEPYVRLEMITPAEYTGALMELGQSRRGIFQEMKYLTESRSTIVYEVGTIKWM